MIQRYYQMKIEIHVQKKVLITKENITEDLCQALKVKISISGLVK